MLEQTKQDEQFSQAGSHDADVSDLLSRRLSAQAGHSRLRPALYSATESFSLFQRTAITSADAPSIDFIMSSTRIAGGTGNVYVNSLLGSSKWTASSLTYSFPTSSAQHGLSYSVAKPSNRFGTFLKAQQDAARAALKLYASVANLECQEITDGDTITDMQVIIAKLKSLAQSDFYL